MTMTRQKIIYWHRITVYTMSGHEKTFMYPSGYKIWDSDDLIEALIDLDYFGMHGISATQSYAGWSLIDIGIDAAYLFYRMEG